MQHTAHAFCPYLPVPKLGRKWVTTLSPALLQELDSEGRVVITDHGAFVLFNIYGPALSSEENFEQRLEFKLKFYKVGEAWGH